MNCFCNQNLKFETMIRFVLVEIPYPIFNWENKSFTISFEYDIVKVTIQKETKWIINDLLFRM